VEQGSGSSSAHSWLHLKKHPSQLGFTALRPLAMPSSPLLVVTDLQRAAIKAHSWRRRQLDFRKSQRFRYKLNYLQIAGVSCYTREIASIFRSFVACPRQLPIR
jgi:hypothetical protein